MRHSLTLRVGPALFRIGSAWASPIAQLRRLYADYPQGPGEGAGAATATGAGRGAGTGTETWSGTGTGEGDIADFTVRLQPVKPWRRWLRPSIFIAGDHMLADAAPMALAHGLLAAEMGMNLQMALGWRRHLLLHAATVEKDGFAVILSGESGSGKSTLAALLGERGWRLMGDEFALLDLATGMLAPFPRLVSLKNQSVDAVRAVVGEDRLGPLMAATAKGDIRHLVPRPDAVRKMDTQAKPILLLFPHFGCNTCNATARPMDAAETFVRLTQASTNYVALGESGFRALTGLVASVPAAAIDYGSGEDGIAIVETLLREARQ
ncbi:HprK-related kinase A [Sphingobium sufflavum]|uniref:HprK-related kinase A n=1 Tax=Sphingobium sufflavum TaxID=1129547 RepID=UPI001F47FEAC|nr:HprK-related kinase A [Sphingobium sufflavum]MCE7795821.1 HprK-related kinase A [Sphingobium sufflavum]